MKLALLVGANPRTSQGGPWVKLHEGNWQIVTDAKNSVLLANHYVSDKAGAVPVEIPSASFVGPCNVQIDILRRGTESHISAYAELVNGSKSD